MNGADVIFIETERSKRGFASEAIDLVLSCGRVVTGWSRGDLSGEAVQELSEEDLVKVYAAAKGVDLPNPSGALSDGGQQSPENEEQPRGSGD